MYVFMMKTKAVLLSQDGRVNKCFTVYLSHTFFPVSNRSYFDYIKAHFVSYSNRFQLQTLSAIDQ